MLPARSITLNARGRARVQDLPPELKHCIFEFVIWDDLAIAMRTGPTCVKVDEGYKPPPQLQIDRTSRRRFADVYYHSSSLFFEIDGMALCVSWLRSLTAAHRSLVRTIRCDVRPVAATASVRFAAMIGAMMYKNLQTILEDNDLYSSSYILLVNYRTKVGDAFEEFWRSDSNILPLT